MDIKNHNRSRVCNQMMKCKWCIKVCVTVWQDKPGLFSTREKWFFATFQTASPRTLCLRPRCPRRSPGLLASWSRSSQLLTFSSPLIKLYQNFSRENSWRGDVTGYVTESPFNPICRFCKRNQLLTRKAVTYHGVITPNLIFIIQSKVKRNF